MAYIDMYLCMNSVIRIISVHRINIIGILPVPDTCQLIGLEMF